ncbi:MAG: CU044_2847 family protein [Sodalinema sp.]|uniref:CU044_2847 family protein n=1 Tax=Sodalinema sp. TaxID=3080550 RepID=UPI00396F392A
MTQLVEFQVEGDRTILIEVEDVTGEQATDPIAGTGGVVVKAKKTFEDTIDDILPLAAAIEKKFSGLTTPANEVEVKFGVKIQGQLSAVVTQIGAEANFEVTLKWKR